MRINMPSEHASNPVAHLAENYAGEIVNAGLAFSKAVYQHSRLSLREFEAARVRTAEINGCKVCQNFRAERDLPGYFEHFGGSTNGSVAESGPVPDEEFYRNVSLWRDYPGFSAREKLAIAYAEGMGTDPQGLAANEDFWQSMRNAFSDAEIVDLTYAVASWMGMGRATHVLGMDSLCAWVPGSE
ncbi:MAG: hypothetical protein WDA24_10720 [Tissierellales bacterium]